MYVLALNDESIDQLSPALSIMCGEVGLTTVTGLLLVTWSADGWQVSSAHPTDPGDLLASRVPTLTALGTL